MVDEIKYKGFNIIIDQEAYAECPRDQDVSTVLAVYNTNYDNINECENLCDADDLEDLSEEKVMTEVYKHYLFNMRVIAILPLHHHQHDGYNVNDCGKQIGFAYMTKKTWDSHYSDSYKDSDWYNKYHAGKDKKEMAESFIRSDVKTYNQWVNNEVYGYSIEYDDESSDSCWGFFGNDYEESELLPNARMEIDYYLERKKEKKAKRLKRLIKSNVPLEHRTL